MKKKFICSKLKRITGNIPGAAFIIVILIITSLNKLHSQQTFIFTTCGATGQFGPNQGQVNATYSGVNSLNGMVTVSGSGIQLWTVPGGGNYKIETFGASGGAAGTYTHFGRGASMQGEFTLTGGQVLKILVGQRGAQGTNGGAGGGGTFVADNLNTPLIVAAGGSGGGNYAGPVFSIMDGLTTNYGASYQSTGRATAGGGGGSFAVSGLNGNGGGSFVSGGAGGTGSNGMGGFGGGAGSGGANQYAAGGGGYSGGDEISGTAVYQANEGGGGSFNAGTNQINAAGVNTGDGMVIITRLCNFNLTVAKNPICIGESVALTTDALAPISWSTGGSTSSVVVSPTTTTSYSVTGTGTGTSGCVTTAVIQVSVTPLPIISAMVNPPLLCAGSPATLTGVGANTYTWNSGPTGTTTLVSPLVSTVFNVSGTNGFGCIGTATVNVDVNPNVLTVSANTTICSGESLNITASGAVTYTWSNGFPNPSLIVSPTVSTIYSVLGIDASNCTLSNSISVTVNPLPTVLASSDKDIICKKESVVLTASGANTYAWSNPVTGSASGASLPLTLNIDIPYVFTVTGTDANGCTKTATVLVDVQKCTGISETGEQSTFVNIYPNPTNGLVTIETKNGNSGTIEIMDLSGKIIFTETIKNNTTEININALATGVYFVKVKNETSSEVIKLIKN